MHFNLYVRKMHENLIINLGLKVFVRKKKKRKKKRLSIQLSEWLCLSIYCQEFLIDESAFDSNPQASSC